MRNAVLLFIMFLSVILVANERNNEKDLKTKEVIEKKCYNPDFKNDDKRFYLSGEWTIHDFRDLTSELIKKINEYDFKELKTIQAEEIKNNTNEHIATDLINEELEEELLKDSKYSFISSKKTQMNFGKTEKDFILGDIVITGEINKNTEEKKISETKTQKIITYTANFNFKALEKFIFQPKIVITHICDIEKKIVTYDSDNNTKTKEKKIIKTQ